MQAEPLWTMTATQAVDLLRRRDVSPADLVAAAAERIDAVDGALNALPIRFLDLAIGRARGGQFPGPLFGLPIAVKDYNDVAGIRTTYGSPIFAQNVAQRSDATVEMLIAGGALPIAKSNVPEWAGGHTANPVLGVTQNPWQPGLTAGGSSGGSAAALAAGLVWLATGNDLGGSLRTPAAFNGVTGLRPTPGIVPRGQRMMPFDTLWVEGPMARNVADLGLMLQAGAGRHPDDPLSVPNTQDFATAALRPIQPKRIGFSADLGAVPVARQIRSTVSTAIDRIAGQGVDITDDIPDFGGAFDTFQTQRAVLLASMMGDLVRQQPSRINPDIIGNVEMGFAVTPEALFQAERTRQRLVREMTAFFKDHDLLICPATSIPPFASDQPVITEIDGIACQTYIDWFAVTFLLTLTGCPIVALPCGQTPDGPPVGMQLVGPPHGEANLLSMAAWCEGLLQAVPALPIDPRPP